MKRCPKCNRAESDDSLAFCRADGTRLVSDGSFVSEGAGTLRFDSTPVTGETETRVLPTDGVLGRTTAPTTVLDGRQTSGNTPELSGEKSRRGILIALAAVLAVALAASAYFYMSRGKNAPAKNSIAVLPFQNASGDLNMEYLSDGITESLINSLSQIPNLAVKARSTMFRYKGRQVDPQQVGSDLNVQAVLNGRLAQRGDDLTLSLELVDAKTGDQMWGEQYNRKLTDLVSLQREIARDVSDKLRLKLSGADEAKLAKTYTTNPEAYQLYLKGKFYWNKRTIESLKQAVVFYEQAIEKDPNYALAYAGLAETYVLFPLYTVALPRDSMPQAKAAASRALQIDDSLAEAHAALGKYLNYFEHDTAGAEKELRRAIELNPNYATARHWLGLDILAVTKRFDEAILEIKRAEGLDPLSPAISADLGLTLIFARRYDEAIAQAKRALTLDPNFPNARWTLGYGLDCKGLYVEAITEYRKSLALNDDPFVRGFLVRSLVKSGGRSEAVKLVAELKSESEKRYVPNYCLAVAYTALGEKKEAFALMEKDIAERSPFVRWGLAVDPALDDLRSDPRFADLMRKVGLPQ